jgi:hypothetical protein
MKIRSVCWLPVIGACWLLGASCNRWPREPERFALALVDRARTDGVPDEAIEADLADRVRRVQLLKRVPAERISPETLAELWRGSAPTGSVADGAQNYRARAAAAIRSVTAGACRAAVDSDLAASRLPLLIQPLTGAPQEANDDKNSLAAALATAKVVRISCDRGAMGLVAVPRQSALHWAVVDLFDASGPGSVEIVH